MSNINMAGPGLTAVDCHKQVRSWRLLRSLVEFLIPTCNCMFVQENQNHHTKHETSHHHNNYPAYYPPQRSSWASSLPPNIMTGTIFGHRRGKVSFSIQTGPKSTDPLLLLELAVPTTILAREMRSGILRIALECTNDHGDDDHSPKQNPSLLATPVWTMYCNGRKVGFAIKRKPTRGDMEVLQLMDNVEVGAGVINQKGLKYGDNEVMYLRGNFESSRGSSDSKSFHLIDPEGNMGQDLSIFFLRSR